MLPRICISVFLLLTLNSHAQNSKNASENIESQIDVIISQMSPKEKVGQTCQITLDVLLARDSSGALIEPAQIDPKKLQIALVDYGVGSVLNVGWHTLRLEDWDHITWISFTNLSNPIKPLHRLFMALMPFTESIIPLVPHFFHKKLG